jgi:membrane protein implicated in regulation of membrane protease activity
MPRDERYPTPLLNINPSGWAGFGAIIVMSLGIWTLFGNSFLIGLAVMIVVALVLAVVIRRWRSKHPPDESVLHLETPPTKGTGTSGYAA